MEESYYIAMEFIEGKTIREILKIKKFAIPTVVAILKQILRGLDYAHSKNIVHRDTEKYQYGYKVHGFWPRESNKTIIERAINHWRNTVLYVARASRRRSY
jgi:serine/threonine protein kinase